MKKMTLKPFTADEVALYDAARLRWFATDKGAGTSLSPVTFIAFSPERKEEITVLIHDLYKAKSTYTRFDVLNLAANMMREVRDT